MHWRESSPGVLAFERDAGLLVVVNVDGAASLMTDSLQALGGSARDIPRFAFGSAVSNPKKFAATAIAIEELGVAAYNGQAANLSKPALQAAAAIVSVNARHAAWIRAIQDKKPASQPTDEAMTRRQVLAEVDRTGFVRS